MSNKKKADEAKVGEAVASHGTSHKSNVAPNSGEIDQKANMEAQQKADAETAKTLEEGAKASEKNLTAEEKTQAQVAKENAQTFASAQTGGVVSGANKDIADVPDAKAAQASGTEAGVLLHSGFSPDAADIPNLEKFGDQAENYGSMVQLNKIVEDNRERWLAEKRNLRIQIGLVQRENYLKEAMIVQIKNGKFTVGLVDVERLGTPEWIK
jgi:hypothetical protein